MHDLSFLFDAVAFLVAAIIVVPLFQALRLPAVLGYLVGGVMLGPHTPGPVIDPHIPKLLAEFGVVFLLFAIGLELPLSRIRTMRRYIFGLGLLQVFVTSAVIAVIAWTLGVPAEAALVVGGMLAFSSTATVLKMLVDRGETVARFGRVSVAVLVFQDLAVVPLLALLPILAGGSTSVPVALAIAAAKAVAAVGLIALLGRFVVRPFYRFVASANSPEVFTATNLALVLSIGWVTAEAGMSMALGAFLAGLVLADTAYRHQVEADIEPFRGLLLGLFFMTVGMSIDLPFLWDEAPTVLGITAALLAGKAALLFGLCRLTGLGTANALRVGLLLAQGGEFAFVLITTATGYGLFDTTLGQILTSVVAVSMAVTPALGVVAHRLAGWVESRWGAETFRPDAGELHDHVVICGYGRVGRAVARVLTTHGIPYLALDLDPNRVAQARSQGLPVFYGDASQPGVLRTAGLDRARAAVITLNRPAAAERAVCAIHEHRADLPIVARAHDTAHHPILREAGAAAVVPETMEASLHLAALLLRSSGLSQPAIDDSLASFRASDYAALHESESP